MSKAVVVVESPAKAKTINKYLGSDFTVLASYGHVRDLPSKDGSVKPEEDFAMLYEVDPDSKKQLSAISSALKNADTLYLATDPDREGEAISWHVLEALKESKSYPKKLDVHRIVFTEITKRAVTEAVANPRDIDMDLVNAQQARRALDYLVGFSLSPVLWRKLPGSRSAGRVQSVALRLLCEREAEIEVFIPQEYWDVQVQLTNTNNQNFKARLIEFNGEKLEKFSLKNAAQAEAVRATLSASQFHVKSITPKTLRRQPFGPFSTSTLQMEASRKLGFGAKKTMQIAQKLYEAGLITYMRTDGITVSQEAIAEARNYIGKEYGTNYVPSSARQYKTKTKNAQEAHEAIRPTDLSRTPDAAARELENDGARLYELIWKRMLASQMEAAVYDQLAVDIVDGKNNTLRANGSVLKFDGFLSLYQETREEDDVSGSDDDDAENSQRLPALTEGEKLAARSVDPAQHFTQAPPRYSEATLVKRLEELGIGRPSTFASIITVLVDRGYASLDKRRFVANPLGRIVTAFLMTFFNRYVAYDFTAEMEERLDLIADGEKDWKQELREFWDPFSIKIEESKKLTITDVLNEVDKLLEPYIFGVGEAATKARVCPKCSVGSLSLKTGKFGAFVGCSNYPDCNYTKQIMVSGEGENAGTDSSGGEFPRDLGTDPKTGEPITLRKGPYGIYVQLSEGKTAKRSGLPKGVDAATVDLAKALSMLALPREVGLHPETGEMIQAGIGRFGPYLLHQKKYTTIPKDDDVLTIGMNRAVTVIAEAANRKPGASAVEVLRDLGKHPESGDDLKILKGRYGPYIKFGKANVTLPKGRDPATVTLEELLPLLPADGKGKGKKKAAKKPAATKTAAAKPATKKPAAKAKKPAKKSA
jgi:DNA topoisomerase-1